MVTTRSRRLWASLLAATLAIGAPGAVSAQPTDEGDEAGAAADQGSASDADADASDQAPATPPADTATEEEEAEAAPPPPPPSGVVEGASTETEEANAEEANAEEAWTIEGPGEVIVVTGSVIERQATTTPAPVAVIDRLDLDASGMVSVGEILQNLPANSNAINVNVNNGGDGSTRINLRGLGDSRTLVLFNGRRVVPGGSGDDPSADLGTIPIAIIERIEVLKDGASAIYGSEAMGGVVNIITRQDYEGSEVNLYTGTTQHGGGTVYNVSMVTGVNSKKGNVLLSAGYYQQKDIFSGQRDWARTAWSYDFMENDGTNCIENPGTSCYSSGSTSTPQGTIFDYGEDTGNTAWDNMVANNPSGAYFNDPTTGWRDFNFNGNHDDGTGDLYNYTPANYLLTPAKRYNLYSQSRWSISDNARAYLEGSYTKRKSSQKLAPEPLLPGFYGDYGITVSRDNYYNPFGRDFWDVRRRMDEGGDRTMRQDNDVFQIVMGLNGKFPEALEGWKWDLNYNFGRSGGTWIEEGHYMIDRLTNALGPSYRDPATGQTMCGTPGNPIPGCVPLDLFGGEGSITQAMLDYITYTGISSGLNTMNMAQASANGLLFTTPWHGDVRLALGAEFRRMRGHFTPDPMIASGNTTGNVQLPTAGYFDVMEGYGELSAVPITDKPGVKWLELSAAIRGFNYDTSGSDFTWKTGLLWKMPNGIGVRGTYSTAFRAPGIRERYVGAWSEYPAVTDPCSDRATPEVAQMCDQQGIPDTFSDPRSQQKAVYGGNPNAEPETAKIFTGGVVYEPPQVRGLALTLDYWWIHVDNSISIWPAGDILSACYQHHEQSACDRIHRNPATNLINYIDDRITNIGGEKTAGLDFQIQYTWNHPSAGRFRHNLEGTFEQKFNAYIPDADTASGLRLIKGTGTYDLGVHPRWKANFSTMWGLENYGAGFNVRYVGSYRECEGNDCNTYDRYTAQELADMGYPNGASRTVEANVTADLYVNYALESSGNRSMLSLGVNNVLDQDPPFVVNSFLTTADTDYDFMGRYFYARFTQSY